MSRACRSLALLAGLLVVPLMSAQAQSVGVGVTVASGTQRTASAEAGDAAHERHDPNCLRYTGTHRTARKAAGRSRKCVPGVMGRAYSREDLLRTGHIDLASALRALDPAVY